MKKNTVQRNCVLELQVTKETNKAILEERREESWAIILTQLFMAQRFAPNELVEP